MYSTNFKCQSNLIYINSYILRSDQTLFHASMEHPLSPVLSSWLSLFAKSNIGCKMPYPDLIRQTRDTE